MTLKELVLDSIENLGDFQVYNDSLKRQKLTTALFEKYADCEVMLWYVSHDPVNVYHIEVELVSD